MMLRESIPRQVDKKSRVSQQKKGGWGSQGGDMDLVSSRRRNGQNDFFFLKPRTDDYTTKQLSLNSVLRII